MATLLTIDQVHAELAMSAEPLHYEWAGEPACTAECAVTTLQPRDVTCDDCIGGMMFRHLHSGDVDAALFWSELLLASSQREVDMVD